jgi:hypothetical protein
MNRINTRLAVRIALALGALTLTGLAGCRDSNGNVTANPFAWHNNGMRGEARDNSTYNEDSRGMVKDDAMGTCPACP